MEFSSTSIAPVAVLYVWKLPYNRPHNGIRFPLYRISLVCIADTTGILKWYGRFGANGGYDTWLKDPPPPVYAYKTALPISQYCRLLQNAFWEREIVKFGQAALKLLPDTRVKSVTDIKFHPGRRELVRTFHSGRAITFFGWVEERLESTVFFFLYTPWPLEQLGYPLLVDSKEE